MRRRTLLRAMGAGGVGVVGGCFDGGGEVVASVQRSVRVEPGEGWVTEVPDVSDPGGSIAYTVRAEGTPFDVYLFVGAAEYAGYEAFVSGDDPAETPRGHVEYSKAAVPTADDGDVYEVSTDDGAREPLEATGPYFFVVDHSSYRMENRVDEFDDRLAAYVDLTVVRKRVGL